MFTFLTAFVFEDSKTNVLSKIFKIWKDKFTIGNFFEL